MGQCLFSLLELGLQTKAPWHQRGEASALVEAACVDGGPLIQRAWDSEMAGKCMDMHLAERTGNPEILKGVLD